MARQTIETEESLRDIYLYILKCTHIYTNPENKEKCNKIIFQKTDNLTGTKGEEAIEFSRHVTKEGL